MSFMRFTATVSELKGGHAYTWIGSSEEELLELLESALNCDDEFGLMAAQAIALIDTLNVGADADEAGEKWDCCYDLGQGDGNHWIVSLVLLD